MRQDRVSDKEFDEFFGDLETVDNFVPSEVGDMFSIRGGGYSLKEVYVVDKAEVCNRWEIGMSLHIVCHVWGDRPDGKHWPRIAVFPSGSLGEYARQGNCLRRGRQGNRASFATLPNQADPSDTTTRLTQAKVAIEPEHSKGVDDCQQQSQNLLIPNDLHPDLVCDIDYSPSEYQWPELPKLDPGPPDLELGLFDTDLIEFFKELDEVEEDADAN